MLSFIEKDSAVNLPYQIRDLIVERIKKGYYAPRKKLDSIRRLSDELQVSRVTVIEALKLLEHENYIQRIPAKGTFVSDDINHELSVVRIAFPFPEVSILPATLGNTENWAMVSDSYRGMVEEARKQNAEISFMHFEEVTSEFQLSRQLRRLENIDGAIFIGHQLLRLQEALLQSRKFCISIASSLESRADTIVTSDVKHAFSELAAYAKGKNYKRLKILSGIPQSIDQKRFEKKIELLTQSFEEVKITTSRNWHYCINPNEREKFSDIIASNDFNFKGGTDIVYISTSDMVPEFYRYCFDRKFKLGQDIGAFGYASGATFANLMPVFTYSKINNFEIGRRACAKCIEAIRSGKHLNHIELVPNVLVKGETV